MSLRASLEDDPAAVDAATSCADDDLVEGHRCSVRSGADFEARTAAQEAELSAVRTESETLAEQIRSDAAESVERAVAEVAELHRARVDELAADRDRLTSLAKEQEDELTALHLELRERDSELATLRTELEERESAVASLKLMLDDVYRGDQADETDDDAE